MNCCYHLLISVLLSYVSKRLLKPSDNLNIRGYTLYNYNNQAGDMASGCSSVIINNSVPQSQIPLNTNSQAIAVKATLHKTIHICSLYLPPNDKINIADLEHLIQNILYNNKSHTYLHPGTGTYSAIDLNSADASIL